MKAYFNTIIAILFLFFMVILVSCDTKPNYETLELNNDWFIQSQDEVNESGNVISTVTYNTQNWIRISIPNTILAGLVEAGIYKDIYRDDNLDKIDDKQFKQSWWYKTQFNIDKKQYHQLLLEGINYKANIWLNGKLIADTSKIEGAFGIWELEISENIVKGDNSIAIQVFPPKYDDLTIGFVDWNPASPDKNMGIWRPVKIKTTGAVSIEEPFVKTDLNTEILAEATLTIKTKVTNHTNNIEIVTLTGVIENIKFEKQIELKAHETKAVVFSPDEFAQLTIQKPKLWWPNLMGEPHMYTLNFVAKANKNISDAQVLNFGIRKVEDYWNESGHKGYKINGKEILIKGAGWVDDILLADTDAKVAAQMEYVKHMNLNCVRLEGFWGRNKTLYQKADELGLLLMIGWSCHWEWEGYCGRYEDDYMCIRTPEDMELQARAYQDQVKWLRNHPSIFTWVYGSDKLPLPNLEKLLNTYILEEDNTRPILASCKYTDFDIVRDKNGSLIGGYINDSEISGPTGVKMLGPYAYTAPSYWYIDKRAGGAYGFNTETGPGSQVPPIESLKKMLSQENLWPINEQWNYHSGRNEFSTLDRFITAFNARYGKATNVEDFAFRAQISNYEAIRAMFEAFEVNKPEATGIIQWMLNSAWPELFWQLYDWYLMPNGAFYGTKKACQPLNVVYNYGDKNVYLTNSLWQDQNNLEIEVSIYDINSELVFSETLKSEIAANTSKLILELPELKKLSTTYFINLQVKKEGQIEASNFYWLSTQPDVHNWEKSEWFYTPYTDYADFTQLNQMELVQVKSRFTTKENSMGDQIISCELENRSNKIAFFIELAIKDKATNETIVPVFWDDNYLSLMPGEKRIVKAKIQKIYADKKELTYRIKGLNLK